LRRQLLGIISLLIITLACGLPCIASESEEENSTGPVFNKGLEGLNIGGLWYLSFQDGTSDGNAYTDFRIKRGYINVTKTIFTWGGAELEARITPDIHQKDDGDISVRLKYAYGKFKWKNVSWEPFLEFGIVHMPWLDFEEHVNMYRMQDPMFMERNSTFNSADIGVTFGGFFGPKLKDLRYYPGKYGSFSVGVYNGGGYHAKENNRNKAIEGRLTVRPFPGQIRGLQFSYFGILGKGNTAEEPDWNVNAGMMSYEAKHMVLTATYYSGDGNQKGDAIDDSGQALPREGYSFFGEAKFPKGLSAIGRFDYFDPNRNADGCSNKRFLAGGAWDMGNHNTWLLDYERVLYEDKRENDERIQVTLQIHF
jgi:hypothetical protein